MDYEKKYKDALQRAKHALDCHNQGMVSTDVSLITSMFPELRESEDEKTRKEIVEYLKKNLRLEWATWLERQSDSPIKWNKNTKDCKPKVSHSVLMKTTHGIAEGEWQGEHWHQYRWAALVRDTDVLSWIELSDLEKRTYEQ